MRFGRGTNWVDNFHAGGILVILDDQGVSIQAYTNDKTKILTHHPDTGEPVVGFKADGFEEVRDLAFRASKKFAIAGTMGWDIVFTPEGPMIIECNSLWGALFQDVSGPIVKGDVAAGLKKRHIFSRYPRDRIFPGIQKKSWGPFKRTRWWT
jgi:hypothetical protein